MRTKRIGLSSRKNIKKQRRRLRLLKVILAFVVVVLSAFAVWHYTVFPLRETVFIGNRHLSDTDMKKLMGLSAGEDLLKLKCSTLAKRALGSPWVRSVSIRKEYPGRLIVKVKEADAFALFRVSGKCFIIDDKGRKLEELRGGAVPFLPTIVADSFSVEPTAFSEALSLVSAIKATPLASRSIEISGVDRQSHELSLIVDGVPVKVGEGQYEEKLLRFAELESEVRRRWQKVDYIDLRFANRVVVRPFKEETLQ